MAQTDAERLSLAYTRVRAYPTRYPLQNAKPDTRAAGGGPSGMPIYNVQVTLFHDSTLAEDNMVNTFHVSGDLGANPGLVAAEFADFYGQAPPSGSNTIFARLSSQLNGAGVVKMYDRADPKPRIPIATHAFSGFTPGPNAIPAEVACCLSYKAAPQAGIPPQRRRNRVYIGPLAQTALTSATDPSLLAAFRTDLTLALQKLQDDVEAVTTGLATLVGFSPTDGIPWPIHTAWVDDAPDIIRKRGKAPQSRVTRVMT